MTTLAPSAPTRKPRTAIRFWWRHLLFAHWRVSAEGLRDLVPRELEIDTFDGDAWIGLVPFTMDGIRHAPFPPIPTMSAFHECNVRTYVTRHGEPGVWFFSLDAMSRLAVWGARTFWHLNYKYAQISMERLGGTIDYSVDRVHEPRASMRARWTVGSAFPPARPGTLAHFLTERYMLYSVDKSHRVWRGRIRHDPWALREATLEMLEDGLIDAAGITLPPERLREPDSLFAADAIYVEGSPLESAR